MAEWKGMWIKIQELSFVVLALSLRAISYKVSFVTYVNSTYCIWEMVSKVSSSSDIYRFL